MKLSLAFIFLVYKATILLSTSTLSTSIDPIHPHQRYTDRNMSVLVFFIPDQLHPMKNTVGVLIGVSMVEMSGFAPES